MSYFNSCFLDSNPTKAEIVTVMAKVFSISISDIGVYDDEEEISMKSLALCKTRQVKGDFKVIMEFGVNGAISPIDESENFYVYKKMSEYFNCRLLVSDETPDTTRYILFENPDTHYIVFLDSDSIDENVFNIDCCEYPRYPQDMHDLPENLKKSVLEEYSTEDPFKLISSGFWWGYKILTAFRMIYFLCAKHSNTAVIEKLLEMLKRAENVDFRFKIFTLKYLRQIPEKYYDDILEMAHELLRTIHNTDYKCDILDGLTNYGNASSIKIIDEIVLKISDKKLLDKALSAKYSIKARINKTP